MGELYCVQVTAEGVDLQPHRRAIVEAAGSPISHPPGLDFEVETDLEPMAMVERIKEELRKAGAVRATIFIREVTDAPNVELGLRGAKVVHRAGDEQGLQWPEGR